MIAFMSLILHVVVSPLKTKARLEAEIIMLRHQLNVLRRRVPTKPKFAVVDRRHCHVAQEVAGSCPRWWCSWSEQGRERARPWGALKRGSGLAAVTGDFRVRVGLLTPTLDQGHHR